MSDLITLSLVSNLNDSSGNSHNGSLSGGIVTNTAAGLGYSSGSPVVDFGANLSHGVSSSYVTSWEWSMKSPASSSLFIGSNASFWTTSNGSGTTRIYFYFDDVNNIYYIPVTEPGSGFHRWAVSLAKSGATVTVTVWIDDVQATSGIVSAGTAQSPVVLSGSSGSNSNHFTITLGSGDYIRDVRVQGVTIVQTDVNTDYSTYPPTVPLNPGVISLSSQTNTSATFSSTQDAQFGTGTISYQWKRASGGGGYSNLTGATSKTLTDSTRTSGTSYSYKRTATDQTPSSADSNVINVIGVTTPSQWILGSSNNVMWDTNQFSGNVDVLLSIDGGNTFSITIASNVSNSGSASYTPAGIPLMNCVLKVVLHSDSTTYGTTSVFAITAPNYIDGVSTPGTSYDRESTITVTWNNHGAVSSVNIQLTSNGVAPGITIVNNYPTSGSSGSFTFCPRAISYGNNYQFIVYSSTNIYSIQSTPIEIREHGIPVLPIGSDQTFTGLFNTSAHGPSSDRYYSIQPACQIFTPNNDGWSGSFTVLLEGGHPNGLILRASLDGGAVQTNTIRTINRTVNQWGMQFRIPPGIPAGKHIVRIIADSVGAGTPRQLSDFVFYTRTGSEPIWYWDSGAASDGSGTFASPFKLETSVKSAIHSLGSGSSGGTIYLLRSNAVYSMSDQTVSNNLSLNYPVTFTPNVGISGCVVAGYCDARVNLVKYKNVTADLAYSTTTFIGPNTGGIILDGVTQIFTGEISGVKSAQVTGYSVPIQQYNSVFVQNSTAHDWVYGFRGQGTVIWCNIVHNQIFAEHVSGVEGCLGLAISGQVIDMSNWTNGIPHGDGIHVLACDGNVVHKNIDMSQLNQGGTTSIRYDSVCDGVNAFGIDSVYMANVNVRGGFSDINGRQYGVMWEGCLWNTGVPLYYNFEGVSPYDPYRGIANCVWNSVLDLTSQSTPIYISGAVARFVQFTWTNSTGSTKTVYLHLNYSITAGGTVTLESEVAAGEVGGTLWSDRSIAFCNITNPTVPAFVPLTGISVANGSSISIFCPLYVEAVQNTPVTITIIDSSNSSVLSTQIINAIDSIDYSNPLWQNRGDGIGNDVDIHCNRRIPNGAIGPTANTSEYQVAPTMNSASVVTGNIVRVTCGLTNSVLSTNNVAISGISVNTGSVLSAYQSSTNTFDVVLDSSPLGKTLTYTPVGSILDDHFTPNELTASSIQIEGATVTYSPNIVPYITVLTNNQVNFSVILNDIHLGSTIDQTSYLSHSLITKNNIATGSNKNSESIVNNSKSDASVTPAQFNSIYGVSVPSSGIYTNFPADAQFIKKSDVIYLRPNGPTINTPST